VALDSLDVALLHGLEISGAGLRIFPPDEVVAAGATQPLIVVDRFSFHAGLLGMLIEPMHVRLVEVTGLQIVIPPHELRATGAEATKKHREKSKIVVDEIVCEKSRLIIGASKPNKEPKHFELNPIKRARRPWVSKVFGGARGAMRRRTSRRRQKFQTSENARSPCGALGKLG
jgi:hypothetical protein